MKKAMKLWMMLMAAVLTLGMTSCSDAEDGEDWETWTIRNVLNGKWSLDKVKVDGHYVDSENLYFEFKFTATGRRFELNRSYEGESVKIDGTFVIDQKNKTIVGTDSNGNKLFTLKINEMLTGAMDATITFHDISKTYDVFLNRFI